MTDLTIPPDAGTDRTKALLQDHLEVGDTVEVRSEERTEDHGTDVVGEVTGFEPGYLEIDGRLLGEGSVRYDEIHTVGKIEGEGRRARPIGPRDAMVVVRSSPRGRLPIPRAASPESASGRPRRP